MESSFNNNLRQFSWSIYDVLDKNETICVSPYSITAALLLLMLGSRGNTRSEITTALFKKNLNEIEVVDTLEAYKLLDDGLTSLAGKNVSIATANRLFVFNRYTVVRKVREQAKRFFGADISLKDFTKPIMSAKTINRWVSKRTNGKIKNLVKSDWIDAELVMFIINAVYFKATWAKQFDPKNTKKRNFYITETKSIEVDMMRLRVYVKYYEDKFVSAISLPFTGGQFEMLFVLPKEKGGLGVIKSLIRKSQNYLNDLLLDENRKALCLVMIPKFTVQSEIDVKKVMQKLRIEEMFSLSRANFSELVEEQKRGLYVKIFAHKVFLDVNEFGVEGAAATAAGIFTRSGDTPFIADHPFLYYIRDVKTRTILFNGIFKPKGD